MSHTQKIVHRGSRFKRHRHRCRARAKAMRAHPQIGETA